MMRNKEVLNEIRKQSRTLIEEKRDKFSSRACFQMNSSI